MKKFKFTIHGNDYNVEVAKVEGNSAKVEVNGSSYEVEIHREVAQSKTPTIVRTRLAHSSVGATAKTAKPAEKKGVGQIKAPLPGTILEIKAKVGDEVKIGTTILVMEAMKMESNIKSDCEGKVSKILVAQGDSVLEGDVLAEIGGE